MDPLVFESCHSTWHFDTEGMRFRRILKGEDGRHGVVTDWRPYHGLEADPGSEAFTVVLNPERTRLLHSWRHTRDCVQCGGHVTSELSLDAVRSAIGRPEAAVSAGAAQPG
jgi:hypothetical protein